MEKVSAMKKVALFMMTQRVVRPMKFAAFISIIISVAVIIGACQGAAGTPGTGGATGPTGPSGQSGSSPDLPLLKIGTESIEIINDGESEAPGDAITIDLNQYLVGTFLPRVYDTPSNNQATEADEIFTAEVSDVGLLTLTVIADTAASNDYLIETFSVTVTDSAGTTADVAIPVRRNRAPTADGTQTNATMDSPITVGNALPDMPPEMTAPCPAAGECALMITLFQDGDTETNNGAGDKEKLTYTVKEIDKEDALSASFDGANLVLVGTEATLDDDDAATTFDGVQVTVTATDEGDLSVDGVIYVMVNGAPTADGATPPVVLTQSSAAVTDAISNLGAYFKDPEEQTLSYKAESTNARIVEVAAANLEFSAGTTISLIPHGVGTTTVTVTAREPETNNGLGQTATQVFTVTVNARS